MKLTIIIPAHNEESTIGKILTDITDKIDPGIVAKILIVNDHSMDRTREVIEEISRNFPRFNIQVIDNETPPGFANALRRGMEEIESEVVVHVMADGCDRIEDIPSMFNKMVKENLDMVCASRYSNFGERCGGSVLKGFFSRFVGVSLYHIIKVPTRDSSNAFKMYKRKMLEDIKLEARGFEISMELCLKAYLIGSKIAEVPTVWQEREQGSSDFKMFKQSFRYIKLYVWGIFNYFKPIFKID